MSEEDYSADPYATEEPTEETTDYSEEAAVEEEEDPTNPTILYFAYGIIHVWMAVLGFLIYGYYPGLMKDNSWWMDQCPSTAWTTTSLAAAVTAGTAGCTAVSGTGAASAACPTIVLQTNNAATNQVPGWTLSDCRKAAPVSQWSTVAYTMLIGDGLVFLVWLLNTILGNNGGLMHMIFFRIFQASALLALLTLVFEIMAMTSYGTKAQVYLSWTGLTLGASVFTSVATNGGTLLPALTALTGNTWVSDKKYVMWKEGSKFSVIATDFSGNSQGNLNGYDDNYSTSTMLSLVSSVLEIAVIVLGWGPFGEWYTYQADLAAAPEEEEEAEDEMADEDAYDAYGCNADGLDVYGNECPAPEY